MRETGIIMSGEHPRLILNGIKTTTRRTYGLEKINENPDEWYSCGLEYRPDGYRWHFENSKTNDTLFIKCPYGGVGDMLWVRETWRILDNTTLLDDMVRVEYQANGQIIKYRYEDIYYNEYGIELPVITSAMKSGKWEPALHLPHIISRISREIKGIRAERLWDITEESAKEEGDNYIQFTKNPCVLYPEVEGYRRGYLFTWDSINGKKYPWSGNWWVWVIDF